MWFVNHWKYCLYFVQLPIIQHPTLILIIPIGKNGLLGSESQIMLFLLGCNVYIVNRIAKFIIKTVELGTWYIEQIGVPCKVMHLSDCCLFVLPHLHFITVFFILFLWNQILYFIFILFYWYSPKMYLWINYYYYLRTSRQNHISLGLFVCLICVCVCLCLWVTVDFWQLPGQVPIVFLIKFWKWFAIPCFQELRNSGWPKSWD